MNIFFLIDVTCKLIACKSECIFLSLFDQAGAQTPIETLNKYNTTGLKVYVFTEDDRNGI